MFPENKKDWEVNVQELDYQEIKKEENKMNQAFIKVNLPVWKVKLLTDSIKVEYEFDNRKVYFYIHSKFAFLNRSKDNNYYFTISLKRDWKYNYYEEDEGVKEKIELNGQELANKITFWTHQVQREKENVI